MSRDIEVVEVECTGRVVMDLKGPRRGKRGGDWMKYVKGDFYERRECREMKWRTETDEIE